MDNAAIHAALIRQVRMNILLQRALLEVAVKTGEKPENAQTFRLIEEAMSLNQELLDSLSNKAVGL